MRKDHKLILLLLALGIVLAAINTPVESSQIVQERTIDQRSDMFFTYTTVKYPAKVEVLVPTGNLTIGFNTGTNELDFGRVETGSSVKKWLNLTITDEKTSRITLKSKGDISPLLIFGKNDFLLSGKDSISVTMNAGSPGKYTGEVAVVVQRSSYDILRQLIGY